MTRLTLAKLGGVKLNTWRRCLATSREEQVQAHIENHRIEIRILLVYMPSVVVRGWLWYVLET